MSVEAALARQSNANYKPEWLRGALAAAQAERGGGTAAQVDKSVFAQLFSADLAAALASPALPEPLVDGTLKGPVLVQVLRAVNVTQPRLESMAECAPERRTLKLQLTDGHRTVTAFELQAVPQLSIVDFGVKLLLRDVQVQDGMLLLQKEGVQVLGGALAGAQAEYSAALRMTRDEGTKAGKKRRIEEKANPGQARANRARLQAQQRAQQQA